MNTPFRKRAFFCLPLLLAYFIFSGHSCKNENIPDCKNNCLSTGPVIIYKTKKDYTQNVSVKLSDDKSRITAYPAESDVLGQKPVKLENGYYLKKMLGNAYLSINIDDYAKGNYDKNKDLKDFIIDVNPFTEYYECCKCVIRNIDSLNIFIKNGYLDFCEDLKKEGYVLE